MPRSSQVLIFVALTIGVFCGQTTLTCAQNDQDSVDGTKPAARALPPFSHPNLDSDSQPSSAVQDDNRPLTGIQNQVLGSPKVLHGYWLLGAQYSNLVRSHPLDETGPSTWNST